MSEITAQEKFHLIARLARGKSCYPWRQEIEERAIDKLMALLDSQPAPPQPKEAE